MIVWWLIHWQNCYWNLWIQIQSARYCVALSPVSSTTRVYLHSFLLIISTCCKVVPWKWSQCFGNQWRILIIRLRERFLILIIVHAKLHGSIAKFHERVCIPSSKFYIQSSFGWANNFSTLWMWFVAKQLHLTSQVFQLLQVSCLQLVHYTRRRIFRRTSVCLIHFVIVNSLRTEITLFGC